VISLSALLQTPGERKEDLTLDYEGLLPSCRCNPSRNNRGGARESGSIGSPHGPLRSAVASNSACRSLRLQIQKLPLIEAHRLGSGAAECCYNINGIATEAWLQPPLTYRYLDYEVLVAEVTCHEYHHSSLALIYTVPSTHQSALTIHLS